MNSHVTVKVTRVTSFTFSVDEIEKILKKECGFDNTARVDWDTGYDDVESATVTLTVTEQE